MSETTVPLDWCPVHGRGAKVVRDAGIGSGVTWWECPQCLTSPPPGASAGREEPAASPLSATAAAMIGALTGCAAMVQAIEGDSPTISEALHEWATAKSDLSRYVASLESALAAERAAGERLLKYAEHRAYCDTGISPSRACTCGLDELRARAADRETEER